MKIQKKPFLATVLVLVLLLVAFSIWVSFLPDIPPHPPFPSPNGYDYLVQVARQAGPLPGSPFDLTIKLTDDELQTYIQNNHEVLQDTIVALDMESRVGLIIPKTRNAQLI